MAVNALPIILALFLVVIYSFDIIIYLIALFAPLSLTLSEFMPGFGFDMFLPTEPLLVGLLIVLLLKLINDRGFDKQILMHPVSLAIYINLLWIFLTALTSTMPIVSFKFLLARIWFVAGLYFLTAKLFSEGKNIEKYVWLYVVSLGIVVFYTLNRHLGYGLWNKQVANFVCNPFYKDHTSYGAALAMYIPFLAMFSFGGFVSRKMKIVSMAFLLILLVAFVLSYTRAAWLSMIVAIGVYVIVKLKIRFKPLFITFISLLVLFIVFQDQIFMSLENNSKQSSANLKTHLSSMTNITSDASNLERLNRWDCAYEMFQEKPFFGYGPGTYMFQYARYQLNSNRTIISTNSADGGNAHSEYLGPLAESGVLGMLTFLLIIGVVIYTAVQTYMRLSDKRLKSIVLAAFIGLVTYYVHGFLNNFLDTDKLSVPFWGFTAMIVAIDIYSRNQIKAQKIRTETSPD
ncbi:MAG: Lipid A core--O-antigen ligase-like [Prolixibacteraceae bacterium]|nr:MAG: Lipid A core--O-antigen ligase-like [Prolixibacteraceae bacterium]